MTKYSIGTIAKILWVSIVMKTIKDIKKAIICNLKHTKSHSYVSAKLIPGMVGNDESWEVKECSICHSVWESRAW